MEKVDEKFKKECLSDADRPTKIIDDLVSRERKALFSKLQSEYHAKGAKNLANTDTPLLAVKEAYYAAMHKANELLALIGYDINSHICSIIGLSRIVKREDLADTLRELGDERINVDYNMDLKNPTIKTERIKEIVDLTENFILEIDKEIIKQRNLSKE